MKIRDNIDLLGETLKPTLCGDDSKLGDFAEFVVGDVAAKCWCCSFWRGFITGTVFCSLFYLIMLLIKELI